LDNKELIFVKSPYWKDFEKYVNKLLDNEVNKLIYTTGTEEKSISQGRAQAYTTILNLSAGVE
jgi:hypothetical protein